jgi:hypothetical protein
MIPSIKVDPIVAGWVNEMVSNQSIMYRLVTSHNSASSTWHDVISDINCIMHDCNMHLNTDYYFQTVPYVKMPSVKILEVYVIDTMHVFQLMLVDAPRLGAHFKLIEERI